MWTWNAHFLRESHALINALSPREGKVLASREIPRVGSHEIQEAGLVLCVTEAKEVLDAGFGEAHDSETQNRRHDLPVVTHAAQGSCVLRSGVNLKTCASLFR